MSEAGIAVKDIGGIKLKPEFLAELVSLTAAGKVSQKNAKQTLEIAFAEGRSPQAIIAEKGWEQISDEGQIAALVKTVLEQEAASVEEARAAIGAGNAKRVKALSNFLAGKVIAASRGKADPVIAGKLLQKELGQC
jgi:aspartyl-tRNA(Asn)/glutamyl-tRNA(Gln) amidotransferase subunit B